MFCEMLRFCAAAHPTCISINLFMDVPYGLHLRRRHFGILLDRGITIWFVIT